MASPLERAAQFSFPDDVSTQNVNSPGTRRRNVANKSNVPILHGFAETNVPSQIENAGKVKERHGGVRTAVIVTTALALLSIGFASGVRFYILIVWLCYTFHLALLCISELTVILFKSLLCFALLCSTCFMLLCFTYITVPSLFCTLCCVSSFHLLWLSH